MISRVYWVGWGLFTGLVSIGFVVLMIVLVAWLIGGERRVRPSETFKAMQILEQRYARGRSREMSSWSGERFFPEGSESDGRIEAGMG
ncbi:MAG: hypothetical protein ACXVEY_13420 [Actinomycetota bacterium]